MCLSTSILLSMFSATVCSLDCLSFLTTYWLSLEHLTMGASAFAFFCTGKKMLKLEHKQSSCSSNKLFCNLFPFISTPLLITLKYGYSSRRKEESYVICSFKRLSEMQDIDQEINLNDYWKRFTHHARCCFSQFVISVTQVLHKSTDEIPVFFLENSILRK